MKKNVKSRGAGFWSRVFRGKRKEFKIYLFRHGQTFYNRRGIFTGWKDSKLSPSGFRDAREVARQLKGKMFQVAFHTSLTRSKQTLKEVLKFHPECKTLIQDDLMIERSYGDLEGTSHKSFIERVGKQAYDLRIEGDAIENISDKKLRTRVEESLGEEEYNIIHRGYDTPPPGGESFADVEKRVRVFIKNLKKFIRENRVNVAISAHGNSIRLFRKIMEGAPRKRVVKWFIPYTRIFEYTVKV